MLKKTSGGTEQTEVVLVFFNGVANGNRPVEWMLWTEWHRWLMGGCL